MLAYIKYYITIIKDKICLEMTQSFAGMKKEIVKEEQYLEAELRREEDRVISSLDKLEEEELQPLAGRVTAIESKFSEVQPLDPQHTQRKDMEVVSARGTDREQNMEHTIVDTRKSMTRLAAELNAFKQTLDESISGLAAEGRIKYQHAERQNRHEDPVNLDSLVSLNRELMASMKEISQKVDRCMRDDDGSQQRLSSAGFGANSTQTGNLLDWLAPVECCRQRPNVIVLPSSDPANVSSAPIVLPRRA
jgi:hypothetical protein